MLKGDTSICYPHLESVHLALQILDENPCRDGAILSKQRAIKHGSTFMEGKKTIKNGRSVIWEAKRTVARLVALQVVGWDEGVNGHIVGGLKGLRMIALRNMLDPEKLLEDANDEKLRALEQTAECEEMGTVEKITNCSKHPVGAVIVNIAQPNAASDTVNRLNGQIREDGKRDRLYG